MGMVRVASAAARAATPVCVRSTSGLRATNSAIRPATRSSRHRRTVRQFLWCARQSSPIRQARRVAGPSSGLVSLAATRSMASLRPAYLCGGGRDKRRSQAATRRQRRRAGDDLPPPHSITSSARARSVGGKSGRAPSRSSDLRSARIPWAAGQEGRRAWCP